MDRGRDRVSQTSPFYTASANSTPSLIFVHGLGSNPDTTWEKANSSYACEERPCDASFGKERVNWVTDFLPDDLPDALRQRTRAFFFNYNSYWQRDASWGRRRVFAQELLHEVFDLAESVRDSALAVKLLHKY